MFYIASGLLHGLLFWALLSMDSKSHETLRDPVRVSYLQIVELPKPKTLPAAKKMKPQVRKKTIEKPTRKSGFAISSVLPKTRPEMKFADQNKKYNHGGESLSRADNPLADWGEGAREFGRLKDYLKMEGAAGRGSGIFYYPIALSRRKIGGFIRTRLVIDKQGKCNWYQSYIRGNRSELRLFVLAVLKKFCSGFRWQGVAKRESANIDFSIHFDTYGSDLASKKINGNVITYYLPGNRQRGSWQFGPIQGSYFFPANVFLNPEWIEEQWNWLVHEEDPMAPFRED